MLSESGFGLVQKNDIGARDHNVFCLLMPEVQHLIDQMDLRGFDLAAAMLAFKISRSSSSECASLECSPAAVSPNGRSTRDAVQFRKAIGSLNRRIKEVERVDDSECRCLCPLDRQGFGSEFTDNDMKRGDDSKGDSSRQDVS
jgi:hypothetical protein